MYTDGENANIEKFNHLFSLRRKEICKITACFSFFVVVFVFFPITCVRQW